MNKFKILTGVFLFLVLSVSSQIQKPPKLMVGIVIDQMREDFLFRFYEHYSDGGFKRLINDGYLCRNVHYNYTPTITAVGHTSIYAGTTPKYHGIIGNSWYRREQKDVVYCVTDSSEQIVGSNSTSIGVSPRNLLSTNISDELKISTNKQGKVYSISTKDRAAVLPAGHMADGAFWLDLESGNYVSSTFYMSELPPWLIKFNAKKLAFKYIDQIWTPLLPNESYDRSIADNNSYETVMNGKETPTFPYDLKKMSGLTDPYFEVLNRSPFSNCLLTDLAIELLKSTQLGHGKYTDLLAISYSATDPVGHTYGPLSVETNDTYLRLDLEISRLLIALDELVGKGNYSIFLTADHGVGEIPNYLIDNKVPAGDLNQEALTQKAEEYLVNNLGQGKWITALRNDMFYLDRDLVLEHNLSLSKVQDMLAYFVNKQEGIAEAFTATQLMQSEYTSYFGSKVQQGFNYNRSGDVKYIMKPGWYADLHTCATHNTAYNYDAHVPLIFYGAGFNKGINYDYHVIPDIAPTISTLLQIKLPSAATGKVIGQVLKKQ